MKGSGRSLLYRWITWLKSHPGSNLLLTAVFISFILAGHDLFVNISIAIMDQLGLKLYNQLVGGLAFIMGMLFLSYLTLKLRKHPVHAISKLLFLFFLSTSIILHYLFLFEMNIEIIHAFQYALLAVLIFPLTGNYTATLIFSLPIMIVDEWLQYIILYPYYIFYFEFNDIVINLLGAGFSMLLLWFLAIVPLQKQRPPLRYAEILLLTGMYALPILGIATCLLAPYPGEECSNTVFIFNQLQDPGSFWQIHPMTQARYHVLLPFEAMLLILVLIGSIALMDKSAKSLHSP